MNKWIRKFLVAGLALCACLEADAVPKASHVFIISIDGGKPAVMKESAMPELKQMVEDGAHTWTARTIFPSLTLPSHTSMLTGVGPDKHKILWNAYLPERGLVPVTTVFAEAKKAGFSTAMIVGKQKFLHLVLPDTVDVFIYDKKSEVLAIKPDMKTSGNEGTVLAKDVANATVEYLASHKPNLCFIHLTDPDNFGHEFGWGSEEQKKSLADVDAAIKKVNAAIKAAGIADDSVVIVTSDHGGHKRMHGTDEPDDMEIPWIAWGKGVKKNFEIKDAVTTYDTAATALWLLDVPCPASFDGKPVTSAFATSDHASAH